MNKKAFTNISAPNLLPEGTLGQKNDTTKSAAAIIQGLPMDKKGPWLTAWRDPIAGIRAFTSCIQLGDLKGDGDSRLIISDLKNKLIVYKGINMEWEHTLSDCPVACALFFSEVSKNPQPSIAVACENAVIIYKFFKPYFRFLLPNIEMIREEIDAWNKYNGPEDAQSLLTTLANLKNNGFNLSSRSTEVLSLTGDKLLPVIQEYKQTNSFTIPDTTTCITSIKKDEEDDTSVSQLVIGTELQNLYILDPSGTQVTFKMSLPSVPVFINCMGLFAGDNKIFVVTRSDKIYIIRRGELDRVIIDLDSKAVAFSRLERNLYVASMDNFIRVYGFKVFKNENGRSSTKGLIFKGTKYFTIGFNSTITNIEPLEIGRGKNVKGMLVALSSKEIRLYNERQLIYSLACDDIVSGMRFGVFGREDGCLVIIYKTQGIDIKLLQRQFSFQTYMQKNAPVPEGDEELPLNIPKRTKLFLEDTQRERDQALDIHRNYQKDLLKLRVKTAQVYLNTLSDGTAPIMMNNGTSLRMHAQVEGLGPNFRVSLKIENSSKKALSNLFLTYSFDVNIYKILKPHLTIPYLIPNISYPISIEVESIDPNGANDIIKIFVCDRIRSAPLIGAMIADIMANVDKYFLTISTMLEEFNNHLSRLRVLCDRPGIEGDNLKDFQELFFEKDQCIKLSNEIKNLFKNGPIKTDMKVKKAKNDFEKLMQILTVQLDKLKSFKERELEEAKSQSLQMKSALREDPNAGNRDSYDQDYELHPELVHQENLIMEKHEEIKKIEKDVTAVHQMMVDISNMVVSQGEKLDKIEVYVNETKSEVLEANKELLEGKRLQKSYMGKMCFLLLIIVAIVLVIVLPLIFTGKL